MDFKSQVLVFSHIPKNAGASVLLALHNALGGARSVSLRMQKIEIIRNGRLSEMTDHVFTYWRKLTARLSGRHYLASAPHDFRRVWLIHGHFRIGEERRSGRQPVYISVVRESVDRFVSYFNYRKDQLPQLMNGRADHPLLDATGTIPATPMEFLDMLIRRRTRDWRNAQVRYFSSAGTFSGARRCIVEKRVITAPMTQLQGFAKLIEREIGTQPLVISHENRGLSRAKASESQLSASDADQIRLYFEEDCRLYELVRDKLPCIGNAGLRMPA